MKRLADFEKFQPEIFKEIDEVVAKIIAIKTTLKKNVYNQ